MLKCSSERWVWAPHSLSAGTSTTPRLSVSFLMAVIWSLLLSRSLGGRGSPWCDGQDGKRAHALGAVDQDPLDIRRCGWTGVESGIVAFAEFRPAISVMEIDDNVGRIEQDDQVLRKIGDRVDAELLVAEQDRPRLGDGEGGADNGEIDIRQILRRGDPGNVAVAGDFRRG